MLVGLTAVAGVGACGTGDAETTDRDGRNGRAAADAWYDERTENGRCTVEYDPERVDPERMMAAIRELGYEPTLLDREAESAG